MTQVIERNEEKKFTMSGFVSSVMVILTNKDFMIHNLAYGINIGVFSAVGTLLNQLVLQYFKVPTNLIFQFEKYQIRLSF